MTVEQIKLQIAMTALRLIQEDASRPPDKVRQAMCEGLARKALERIANIDVTVSADHMNQSPLHPFVQENNMVLQGKVALSPDAIRGIGKQVTSEHDNDSDEGSSALNYISIRYFFPFAILGKAVLGKGELTFEEFNGFVENFDVLAENHFCGASREVDVKRDRERWPADLKTFAQRSEGSSEIITALKTIVIDCNPCYTGRIHAYITEKHFLAIMSHVRNGTKPRMADQAVDSR
jgi:hypothetical protein